MKKLTSGRIQLPEIVFITDMKERALLSTGVHFILGLPGEEEFYIRLLEYEALWQAAIDTKLPFNFKLLLEEAGFTDLFEESRDKTLYVDYIAEQFDDDDLEYEEIALINYRYNFRELIKDISCYVDINKLRQLKLIPSVIIDHIEPNLLKNTHDFITYDLAAYNKKLDGFYGAASLTTHLKNIIIIDISASIPKAVATATLLMGKNHGLRYYCDILITGTKSFIVPFEEVYNMDVEKIYAEAGGGNERKDFKKLMGIKKLYDSAIVYGDNNHPGESWAKGEKKMSDEEGKKLCKWKINKLISLHTDDATNLAGYARWFIPKETIRISNWVQYFNSNN